MGRAFLHFFMLTLLLGAAPAWAQSWIPVGPPGGNVRSLVSDPRSPERIYLGTAGGLLYRSDDGGLHWHRPAPGFPLRDCSLDEIVVDPRGAVFVGYWEVQGSGGGVARSTDGGQTFTLLKGIEGESVRALAVAPSDSRVIASGTRTGVFLSRDGGLLWKRITPEHDLDLRNIGSLAFDPSNPRIIYIGTWHLGWKTLDGGASWIPMHRGMIDDSDVMTLTIDRTHPKTIYATACTGIYRSTEDIIAWTKLTGIPESSRRTRAFSQGGENGNLLLAGTTEGLWLSEDKGATWRLGTSKELVVNVVLVQPGGTIILGTEGAGVLRSSDLGRTWKSSNAGFSERFVSRLVFDPAGRRVLVAVSGDARYGGVFVSSRMPGPWTRLAKGLDGRRVLSLTISRTEIVAGTDDGIFAWAATAKTWRRVPVYLEEGELRSRVTELLTLSRDRLLAATSKGVIQSRDGGQTWTRPMLGRAGEISDLALCPDDSNLVMVATRSGFFRSEDGGSTWRQVSSELSDVVPHALAFMPSSDRVLFVTTTGGLFRSADQGTTWSRVTGGIPRSDLTGIAIHPDGRTMYASDFTWGGIFRSADGGSKWERMPTLGLASDRVWTLGLDPSAPDRLLAASRAGGLHLFFPTAVAGGPQDAGGEQTRDGVLNPRANGDMGPKTHSLKRFQKQ
jgi:photosystem II stability/assembly factor-like uncharacterized protein